MSAGKTVTVTGATGTLGRRVVADLLDAGIEVRAVSRNPPDDHQSGLEWVIGDLSAEVGMEDAFAGTNQVIHCATNSRSPKQDLAAAHNLIAALAPEGVPLTYISIVGVDRIPLGYYRIKLEVEGLVQGSGLPWTILRATQFHNLISRSLGLLAHLPLMPLPADTSVQPVEVNEVAQRLVELIEAPGSGRAPDFGGPQILATTELARVWLARADKRRRLLPVRIPGKTATAFREGHHLAPDHADGTGTFADFLTGEPRR